MLTFIVLIIINKEEIVLAKVKHFDIILIMCLHQQGMELCLIRQRYKIHITTSFVRR